MTLEESLESIKNKFTERDFFDFNQITELEKIHLASMGLNDTEGYQVFTPRFIVEDMIKGIGEDVVFDISKTLLEPTSGDGAFTVYILNKRLERLWKNDKTNFFINSLKALSTIYSVEMDESLIVKQRNNIFTCVKQFIKKKKIDLKPIYYEFIKCIIVKNFIWGRFDTEIEGGLYGVSVIYKMTEVEIKKNVNIDFAVWSISNDLISYRNEGVYIW